MHATTGCQDRFTRHNKTSTPMLVTIKINYEHNTAGNIYITHIHAKQLMISMYTMHL